MRPITFGKIFQQVFANFEKCVEHACRPWGLQWNNQTYEEYYCGNLLYTSVAQVPYHATDVAWVDNTNFARPSHWKIGDQQLVPNKTDSGIGRKWVCPRGLDSPHLSRIALLAPKAGEVFYLRALLKHFPARSHAALYNVSGVANL